jgi:hypothetical protein
MKLPPLYSTIYCLAACGFAALLSPPAGLAGDTIFGDLEVGLVPKNQQADQACCDRGIYSKHFDLWLKAYVNGRSAEADKEWAGVLKEASAAHSLDRLASGTYTRLEFIEGEDSKKLDKLGGPIAGVIALYKSSEHILGVSEKLATLGEYISNQEKNSSRFSDSAVWAKKVVELREQVWGRDNIRVGRSLVGLADCLYRAGDYAGSRSSAQRGMAIAAAARSAEVQYEARLVLGKLSRIKNSK